MVYIMVFTTEGFFEAAIESWPKWDFKPRPHEFNSHSEPTLYSYSNFIVCSVSCFISAVAFVSRHVYFNLLSLLFYFIIYLNMYVYFIYMYIIYIYICIIYILYILYILQSAPIPQK